MDRREGRSKNSGWAKGAWAKGAPSWNSHRESGGTEEQRTCCSRQPRGGTRRRRFL